MPEVQLSLSWDAYQKNIYNGLMHLQQRGEFVDMTLAADGHHVKVHQMVLSLVSPYIKDLISSARCPHPVIFLNNISYRTLSSIIEYIYTGEVLVLEEQVSDFLAAGRALHIRGLLEMNDARTGNDDTSLAQHDNASDPIADFDGKSINNLTEKFYEQQQQQSKKLSGRIGEELEGPEPICKIYVDDDHIETDDEDQDLQNTRAKELELKLKSTNGSDTSNASISKEMLGKLNSVQYSLSNQGGLQIIVNRYIYTLKYVQKKLLRFWRCADCANKKCRAVIYTNEKNQIVRRSFTHNHPYHDETILKKLRRGIVYSAYNEAETRAKTKTSKKNERPSLNASPS